MFFCVVIQIELLYHREIENILLKIGWTTAFLATDTETTKIAPFGWDPAKSLLLSTFESIKKSRQ